MHNFTVSAQDILPSESFGNNRKFYRNLASTNADDEMSCTVQLTSPVVMIQGLQPKGCEFKSTSVFSFLFLFLPLFDSFKFICYRCTASSE